MYTQEAFSAVMSAVFMIHTLIASCFPCTDVDWATELTMLNEYEQSLRVCKLSEQR